MSSRFAKSNSQVTVFDVARLIIFVDSIINKYNLSYSCGKAKQLKTKLLQHGVIRKKPESITAYGLSLLRHIESIDTKIEIKNHGDILKLWVKNIAKEFVDLQTDDKQNKFVGVRYLAENEYWKVNLNRDTFHIKLVNYFANPRTAYWYYVFDGKDVAGADALVAEWEDQHRDDIN